MLACALSSMFTYKITKQQYFSLAFSHKLKDFVELMRYIKLVIYIISYLPIFQVFLSPRISTNTSAAINFLAPWFIKPVLNLTPCLVSNCFSSCFNSDIPFPYIPPSAAILPIVSFR